MASLNALIRICVSLEASLQANSAKSKMGETASTNRFWQHSYIHIRLLHRMTERICTRLVVVVSCQVSYTVYSVHG